MNEEVAKRIQENKDSKDRTLDLSGLELTAILAEVGELVWLTELNFDNNKIKEIKYLSNLINLETLSFEQNQINKIEGFEYSTDQ